MRPTPWRTTLWRTTTQSTGAGGFDDRPPPLGFMVDLSCDRPGGIGLQPTCGTGIEPATARVLVWCSTVELTASESAPSDPMSGTQSAKPCRVAPEPLERRIHPPSAGLFGRQTGSPPNPLQAGNFCTRLRSGPRARPSPRKSLAAPATSRRSRPPEAAPLRINGLCSVPESPVRYFGNHRSCQRVSFRRGRRQVVFPKSSPHVRGLLRRDQQRQPIGHLPAGCQGGSRVVTSGTSRRTGFDIQTVVVVSWLFRTRNRQPLHIWSRYSNLLARQGFCAGLGLGMRRLRKNHIAAICCLDNNSFRHGGRSAGRAVNRSPADYVTPVDIAGFDDLPQVDRGTHRH